MKAWMLSRSVGNSNFVQFIWNCLEEIKLSILSAPRYTKVINNKQKSLHVRRMANWQTGKEENWRKIVCQSPPHAARTIHNLIWLEFGTHCETLKRCVGFVSWCLIYFRNGNQKLLPWEDEPSDDSIGGTWKYLNVPDLRMERTRTLVAPSIYGDTARYACYVRDKCIFAALRQRLSLEVNLNDFRSAGARNVNRIGIGRQLLCLAFNWRLYCDGKRAPEIREAAYVSSFGLFAILFSLSGFQNDLCGDKIQRIAFQTPAQAIITLRCLIFEFHKTIRFATRNGQMMSTVDGCRMEAIDLVRPH